MIEINYYSSTYDKDASKYLYLVNLGQQLTLTEQEMFRPFIPQEKWERVGAFRHWQDRQRTILGYGLANYLLAQATDIPREKIELTFDYYGKGHLVSGHCYFNISHAGEWIISAVNQTPIGLDIEKIQEIDLGIANNFFAPEEVEDLYSRLPEERLDYFFTLWVLKESYIKAVGRGVSIPLNSFWFRVINNEEIEFNSRSDDLDWKFKLYESVPGYKIASCVREDLPVEVRHITIEEILKA